MPTNILGSGALLFPLAQGQSVPAIGQAFDPVSGTAPAVTGFDPPADSELNLLTRVNDKSKYFSIYDASSFADATDFDLQTSGGGWGASVGMSLSASSRIQSNATTYTVHLNAAATSSQKVVNSGTALSPSAAARLAIGLDKFVAKYGTHFVAGYVCGKACKLSYHMKFSSLSVKEKFRASYSESTSELGFSDSLSASLSNALSLSHTNCTVDFESNCIGFNYDPPSKIADLATIAAAYGKADAATLSPVAVVVMPWSFLAAVGDSLGTDLASSPDLADLVNGLLYIQNSCGNFIARQLYAGNAQFQNVSRVRSKVGAEIGAILAILSAANKSGDTVSATNDGQQVTLKAGDTSQSFALSQPIQEEMKFALDHFALSWTAYCDYGVGPAFTWRDISDLEGKPVKVAIDLHTMDGRKGTWFSWADNSAGWTVTRGTTRSAYNLAQTTLPDNSPDNVFFTVLIDWAKGTIRGMVRCPAGQGDIYTDEIGILNEVNNLDCEDPSNRSYRISAEGVSDQRTLKFHLSPI
jgi:hypothetical protein